MNSLFGLSSPLITELYGNISLHQDVVADFKDLQKKASKFNIELEIISGYRSFSRQKIIWNRNINDSPSLNDILKRLRWSAFPGLSRHHWGSDFDVVDNIPLKKNSDYNVSLEPFEYSSKGIFSKLGQFLDESLQDSPFYRPYAQDLGGVAIEPWHLSHLEVSSSFFKLMNLEKVESFIQSQECQDIHGIEVVQKNIETIFERFVVNITKLPEDHR